MKKGFIIFCFALTSSSLGNVFFTIGSNYFLTIRAYPHDLLRWPKKGLFFYMNPQRLPWQGDVTNLFNRPSESYVNNYQEVEFAPPYGYVGDPMDVYSWMKMSSYIYQNRFTLGGILNTGFGRFLIEIGATSMDMELNAEGVGRAYKEVGGNTEYYLIPFEGQTGAARNNYDIQVVYAHQLFNNPFGVKIRYIQKSSDLPEGFIKFTREGTTFETPHLTWGWATTSCNHIFGYSHINTDAFYQDYYSVYNGYQLDVQTSFEIQGNYKSGIRYRRNRDEGENYFWEYDEGSDVTGNYFSDPYWNQLQKGDLLRAFSKVRFWRIGNFDAGILFFLQYDAGSDNLMNKIIESDPAAEAREKQFVIETNPFFNYTFRGGYVDFGLLLEYARTGMNNVNTRWNPVSNSDQKDVLWNTTPYKGWSQPWEYFSKGSAWFFATGFEAYSSIGVHKNLSLLLRLMVLKKFTFTNKLYGNSDIPAGKTSYEFIQSHERDSEKDETWMTGSFGLQYRLGSFEILATMNLPLAYLIKQKTALQDNQTQLFEHSKRNMWQVQQPATFEVFLIHSLGS